MNWYLSEWWGLRREKTAVALRLGTVWHKFMELGLVHGWDVARDYLKSPEVVSDPEVGELVGEMARASQRPMEGVLQAYEVLGVEVPFCLKIERKRRKTNWVHPNYSVEVVPLPTEGEIASSDSRGLTMYYCGVMDGHLKHSNSGSLWVMEHKTTQDNDETQFSQSMERSYQILGYALAMMVMNRGSKFGGVFYDAVRKKAPCKPAVNKCKFCDEGFVKPKKGQEAGTIICSVCDGTGKGLLSSRVVETTAEVIQEVLDANPQLAKPEYEAWRQSAFQTWKFECLRISRPFWFGYFRSVNLRQIQLWLDEMWQVGLKYKRMLKHKGSEQFVRDLSPMVCKRCSMAELCLGGGEWTGVPDGYIQVPRTEVPQEVMKASCSDDDDDDKNNGDDCPF
jgi:hypothetical protein